MLWVKFECACNRNDSRKCCVFNDIVNIKIGLTERRDIKSSTVKSGRKKRGRVDDKYQFQSPSAISTTFQYQKEKKKNYIRRQTTERKEKKTNRHIKTIFSWWHLMDNGLYIIYIYFLCRCEIKKINSPFVDWCSIRYANMSKIWKKGKDCFTVVIYRRLLFIQNPFHVQQSNINQKSAIRKCCFFFLLLYNRIILHPYSFLSLFIPLSFNISWAA